MAKIVDIPEPLGDGLLHLAVLVWVSVGVGPWWVGVVLFVGALAVNLAQRAWIKHG